MCDAKEVRDYNKIMDIDIEREALRELNDYAYSILKETEGKLQTNTYGREAYLLGLYISAIAQVQGILCLADNKQYRVSKNLVRSLYEIWINVRFIYCARTFVYARAMVHISEQERLKKLESLKNDGHVTQADYDKHNKRIRSIEKFLARVHPRWPDTIPNVIQSGTPVTRKKINLKQCCQIIDFYNTKYHRVNKKAVPMVKHYDGLYPYLSGGAHADPVALGQAFTEKGGQIMHIDIDGSGNPDEMARHCSVAFAFHYELITTVKYAIFKERPPKMSNNIEKLARDKGLIR